jgi:hypothetical protein
VTLGEGCWSALGWADPEAEDVVHALFGGADGGAEGPDGGALTVVVDDTLFHRYGKKVHDARYQHDGSAKGRDGIGRGNCFVIAGVVVAVPFLAAVPLVAVPCRVGASGRRGL